MIAYLSMKQRAKLKRVSAQSAARPRTAYGACLAEFGPCMVCFILFIMIPMVDIGTTFVRYWMAFGVMNTAIHRLSMEDKMSDVANRLKKDLSWSDFISQCGVEVAHETLALHIISSAPAGNKERTIDVPYPAPVPTEWLPNGTMGPCIYYMKLTLQTNVKPLFQLNLGGLAVPGLTEPVPMTFTAMSAWENLGRDPDTTQYFLNE